MMATMALPRLYGERVVLVTPFSHATAVVPHDYLATASKQQLLGLPPALDDYLDLDALLPDPSQRWAWADWTAVVDAHREQQLHGLVFFNESSRHSDAGQVVLVHDPRNFSLSGAGFGDEKGFYNSATRDSLFHRPVSSPHRFDFFVEVRTSPHATWSDKQLSILFAVSLPTIFGLVVHRILKE